MKVKLSLLPLVMALVPMSAFAQTGIAGKWVGELSATDGHGIAQPITLDLKLDGEALSGTVTEGALEARPIQSAAVDGSTVTFRTVRNLGGADINVNWKGELKGEDLTLTREIGPAPQEAGGGRGGRGAGGANGAAGGRGGGRGAGGGAAGGAAAVPPVPAPEAGAAPDGAGAAAAGGRGGGRGAGGGAAGGQRGGGARGGGGAAPAGGGAGAPGGRGAAAAAAGPTVTLTLHRSR